MLVLTRRLDETTTIGDPHSSEDAIEVTVIEVRGDQVRLGIKAPRETSVHRTEVYQQIKDENRAAAVGTAQPSAIGKTLHGLRRKQGSA